MAKYTIEIVGEKNESLIFPPTGDKLRGRWSFEKVAGRIPGEAIRPLALAARTIPGECLSLDTEAGVGKRFDPLTETEIGRKILETVGSNYRRGGASQRFKGNEPSEWNRLTPNEVKTWAFHMANAIEMGIAQYVPGSAKFPDSKDIRDKWKGGLKRDPLRENRADVKGELPEFVSVVDK